MKRTYIALACAAALFAGGSLYAQDGESITDQDPEGQDQQESSEDVEATVMELEELMQLPLQARLIRESEEDPENPFSLFSREEVRRTLLGEDPDFIYIPSGTDPMLIPWVRSRIVAAELLADAERMFADAQQRGDRELARRALPKLEEIRTEYPNEAPAEQAVVLAQRINEFVTAPQGTQVVNRPEGPAQPQRVQLPPWVETNTSGVLIDLEDPTESIVLVQDFILRQGDPVPRFPAVTVKEIRPRQVVYELQDVDFLVPVTTE